MRTQQRKKINNCEFEWRKVFINNFKKLADERILIIHSYLLREVIPMYLQVIRSNFTISFWWIWFNCEKISTKIIILRKFPLSAINLEKRFSFVSDYYNTFWIITKFFSPSVWDKLSPLFIFVSYQACMCSSEKL